MFVCTRQTVHERIEWNVDFCNLYILIIVSRYILIYLLCTACTGLYLKLLNSYHTVHILLVAASMSCTCSLNLKQPGVMITFWNVRQKNTTSKPKEQDKGHINWYLRRRFLCPSGHRTKHWKLLHFCSDLLVGAQKML